MDEKNANAEERFCVSFVFGRLLFAGIKPGWFSEDVTTTQVLDSLGLRHGTKHGVPTSISNGKISESMLFLRDRQDWLTFVGPISNPNGFTINMWVKRMSIGNTMALIDSSDCATIYFDSASYILGFAYRDINGIASTINWNINDNGAHLDTWHMITAIYDKNNKKQTLWWDGNKVGERDLEQGKICATASAIGARTGGSLLYDGEIDMVDIWHSSLNEISINQLWNSGNGINPITGV